MITRMRKPIKVALIAALVPEFACLLIVMSNPEGLPNDASALERFLAHGVEIVHWPARFLIPLFNVLGASGLAFLVKLALIFAIGYLEWAVLICAILYVACFVARISVPPNA
jgi:hypothetical protein